ncbi:YaeQ family protein [Alkalimonas collagenimarina]|uniref:YaeQ family protein n=1 Tax=Alkalimonas collagenimarina TaxID=400390 RepID=A0ABT9GXD5_9GAMM|nr:YaeQ family protein [Alkalimonas collagenimarina]MDP4535707.1 YaeQ family protein [Alkalimonas collagenimarina]
MALKATVFKVQLNIADMDRGYYADHSLTLAQHPSETDTRMMVRLLAFALNASDTLAFTKGLSSEADEPELWDQSLSGEVNLWVEFGQPDEKWLRKACGRAKKVQLYCYGGRSTAVWWQQQAPNLQRYQNLAISEFAESEVQQLAAMVNRSMELQCTITEGQVWLSNQQHNVHLTPLCLKQ